MLLWGWAWEGAERTSAEIESAGWCGTLTSPREVVLRGDSVRLEPATELTQLRRERAEHPPSPGKWAQTTTLHRFTLWFAPTFRVGAGVPTRVVDRGCQVSVQAGRPSPG